MITAEALEALFKINLDWVPRNIYNGIGHFNVFKPDMKDKPNPVHFGLRNYYRIMLLLGKSQIYMADKTIEVGKQALIFSNPQGAYTIISSKDPLLTYYCIFTHQFLQKAEFKNFSVMFKPNGVNVYNLSDAQVNKATGLYELMLEELSSDYLFKYDVTRILVSDLLHLGMKLSGLNGKLSAFGI